MIKIILKNKHIQTQGRGPSMKLAFIVFLPRHFLDDSTHTKGS